MPLHFKTKKDYLKSTAYLHIHGVKHHRRQFVFIGGKKHKVKHIKKIL